MKLEPIIEARDTAEFTLQSLQTANKGCSALEHIIVLDLIQQASDLASKIDQLLNAMTSEE